MGDWYENSYPLQPNSSFSRKRESRGEGWHQPRPNTSNDQASFSYLRVRRPPACAIAMKACPGPRSGIDRCGSLSFAIRGIASPFAASLRQSGPPFVIPAKAGNPEGWGGVRPPDDPEKTHPSPHFHDLGVPAAAGMTDWYENALKWLSSAPLNPSHSAFSSFRPPNSSFPRRRESRGEVDGRLQRDSSVPTNHYAVLIPWCAGGSWHGRLARKCAERLLSAPAPAGMDDRYENRLPQPVSSFQRKLESRRGGVGDRDEDLDDGAAPVGTNAAACLLGARLGTSPSATFLPFHCQMLIHGSGKIGWPA